MESQSLSIIDYDIWINIRKFFYWYNQILREIHLISEDIIAEEGVYSFDALDSFIEQIENKLDNVNNSNLFETWKELEKHWFYPFLKLFLKLLQNGNAKEKICWIGTGLLEFDISGDLKKSNWVYFCDSNYLKNIIVAFSVIGNPKYKELLEDRFIISYSLLEEIRKKYKKKRFRSWLNYPTEQGGSK